MQQLLRILLMLIIACTSIRYVQAQFDMGLPLIKNYKATDYNAQTQMWGAVQDSAGLVYFGNNDGVIVFTGRQWIKVPVANRSIVRSLAVFRDTVFVGASNEFGFLEKSGNGQFVYQSISKQLPDTIMNFKNIHNIKNIENHIYFITDHYIFDYHHGKISIIKSQIPLQLGAFTFDGELYMYLTGKGLGILKNNQILPIPGSEQLISKGAVNVIPFNDKHVLVSTIGGLYEITDNTDGMLTFSKMNTPLSAELSSSYIFEVAEIKGQYFAFATLRKGVVVVDESLNLLKIIDQDAGLVDNVCTSVLPDYSGNLWAITQNGVSFIELQAAISVIDSRLGVKSALTESFLYENTLYYGSNFELLAASLDKNTPNKNIEFKSLSKMQSQVWRIDTLEGKLLIAQRNGLFELIDGQRKPLITHKGNIWDFATSAHYKEHLFLGGDSVYIVDKKRMKIERTFGLPIVNIRWFAFDNSGRLWISDIETGIYRMQFASDLQQVERIDKFGEEQGLPSNELNYIWMLNGQITAATPKGLFIFDNEKDRFEPNRQINQLIGNVPVWFLETDHAGGFYYIGNTAMGQVVKQNDQFTHKTVPYNRFPSHIAISFYNYVDSLIFLGFPDKGVIINRKAIKNEAPAFRPFIKDLTATVNGTNSDSVVIETFGSNYPLIEIQTGATIHINFDAPFFTEPEKNLFSYQLVGFDSHYSSWTSENFKEYTNLPDGTFTFKIKAKNIFDQESLTASITFTILKPWYKEWWAVLGYLVLVGGVIVAIVKIYTYRLKKHNQWLEQLVKDRTQQINKKNEILNAQKHELELNAKELSEKNEELTVLTEFRKNISHMMVHDLKNPLNIILGMSEKPFVQEAGQIMLNLVNNILDVQKFEDANMKVHSVRNSVSVTVKTAIERIRLAADSKEIAIANRVSPQITVFYDVFLIERVLENLLTNAIKYTPVGGQIHIEVIAENNVAKILVSDSGKGIDEKNMTRIFEKFAQIEPEKLGVTYSTGLGLTFCKLAVEAHNGEIGVYNNQIGATFFFTLPGMEIDANIQPFDTTQEQTDKALELTSEQASRIIGLAPQLLTLQVYQRTQLEQCLKSLQIESDEVVLGFVNQLIKSIRECDSVQFGALVTQIKEKLKSDE